MGFMDKVRGMAGKHSDKLDQVGEKVDEKTGGKYSDQINQGTEKAKGYLGEQSGEGQQDQQGGGQQGGGPQGEQGQQGGEQEGGQRPGGG